MCIGDVLKYFDMSWAISEGSPSRSSVEKIVDSHSYLTVRILYVAMHWDVETDVENDIFRISSAYKKLI